MGALKKAYMWYDKKIDHTPCDVEFPKRFLSYVVDWGLGGIFTGLPAVLLYGSVSGRSDMFSNLYIFEALGYGRGWAYLAGFCALLFALGYYVYVPWKLFPGQTLGKRICGYRICRIDGKALDLKTLLLRQVVGLFLLESIALVISGYLRQMVTLTLLYYVDSIWSGIGTICCVLSAMLVGGTPSHRALHDYLAKTRVELYDKQSEQTGKEAQKKEALKQPAAGTANAKGRKQNGQQNAKHKNSLAKKRKG